MVEVVGEIINSIWVIINVAADNNSDHYVADKQTLNIVRIFCQPAKLYNVADTVIDKSSHLAK
ncbi:hypothetical protein [Psychrobacter sp. P11G3]|uniref:hypothetical protein n=1 Tax=Psychrobacter sp. P11G3 TaxID=1699623 RepID=UPI00070B6312|nr:hypothetical protein [Psychrobacter sp. P11G3]KRG33268.1 hypothetical protein AK824_12655 [Psychrobacter sp. P11G3]